MSGAVTESVVGACSLDWFRGLGCKILSGLAIAPGEPSAECSDYNRVFLFDRLQTTLQVAAQALLPILLWGELRVPRLPD